MTRKIPLFALLLAICAPVAGEAQIAPGGGCGQSSATACYVTSGGAGNAVTIAPSSAASAGISPVFSAAAESGHVLKAAAGNLYSLVVTTGATAGYVMTFNSTTVPADGAVTPVNCWQVSANNTISGSWLSGPAEPFSIGIVAVFSSTGCFNKAASATAFFTGAVQ